MIQVKEYGSVSVMLPMLFSVGSVPVSSFGVFLALGFLTGLFLIWRLARAWDLDEEKILDLTLLTFFGGLAGSRLYFGIQHPELFAENYFKILLIHKIPGFSFWGAFLGGWLTLYFFSRRKKMDFWLLSDFASVGFLGGLILSNLGCLLGSCSVGIQSNLFFAVNMANSAGKRFPTQALEAALLFLVFLGIWSTATHFHIRGKIVGLTLVYVGMIKFLMEPLKVNHEGLVLSLILSFLGMTILYKVTKRNLIADLKTAGFFIPKLIMDSSLRKSVTDKFKKYWYNQITSAFWKLRSLKKLLWRVYVRFSYKNN